MKTIRNIWSQLPIYLVWLILSAVLWGWIFTLLTDTSPEKKVTLFAEVDYIEDDALSAELERTMPEGLRMIQVHPFSYSMFQESTLLGADLYIVPGSSFESYRDSFAPLPQGTAADLIIDGVPYGLLVYDASADTGAARDHIRYTTEGEKDDYYLFLGSGSPHLDDGKAWAVAQAFMKLWEEHR